MSLVSDLHRAADNGPPDSRPLLRVAALHITDLEDALTRVSTERDAYRVEVRRLLAALDQLRQSVAAVLDQGVRA